MIVACGEGDLIGVSIRDQGVVHTGGQHFAALGEAPPLLDRGVSRFPVYLQDKQSFAAVIAGDQRLLFQGAPEVFAVRF